MVSRDEQKEAMMQEFINEYQRKHYEACVRAQEDSKKHPLSSAEMRSIVRRHREMVRACDPHS